MSAVLRGSETTTVRARDPKNTLALLLVLFYAEARQLQNQSERSPKYPRIASRVVSQISSCSLSTNQRNAYNLAYFLKFTTPNREKFRANFAQRQRDWLSTARCKSTNHRRPARNWLLIASRCACLGPKVVVEQKCQTSTRLRKVIFSPEVALVDYF